jgi:hypothetical protein
LKSTFDKEVTGRQSPARTKVESGSRTAIN